LNNQLFKVAEFINTLFDNVVIPDTFKDDIHVVLFDTVVNPDTFNDDDNVVLLFNVVNPDTLNDDIHVVLFDKVVNPDTFNDDNIVVLLFIVIFPSLLFSFFQFLHHGFLLHFGMKIPNHHIPQGMSWLLRILFRSSIYAQH
jgi:hypothetical protein